MDLEQLKAQAQEALDSGDLAKANEIIAQIKALKANEQKVQELSDELAELTKAEEKEQEKTDNEEVEEDLYGGVLPLIFCVIYQK